ncbi:MAG: thiol peroxidase [Calditrichaeota bacterium]|nr:MAG: thiol peroxidase [Calditrichota bacterium]MBL1207108.1 thiol peroxidase [Calditrichota bacterium]NOG46938.1 thiol peroxidase [Calditrichota bacterium]
MAQITLKGNPINTIGNLPEVGSQAPDFVLTKTDLSDVSLKDFAGKRIILNISPSIDTGICADSVRRFNVAADKLDNTAILYVSLDLPFAHKRFCEAEGIESVVSVCGLRTRSFGKDYGVLITDGPMAGLFARSVVIVDEHGKVVYTEQVPEIVQEPNYEAALEVLA